MKPELSANDWELINASLLQTYRELEPARHTRAMLEAVDRCAPNGYVALNHYNPATRHYFADTLPENISTPEDQAVVGRYLHQSPFVQYHLTTGDPQWKTISDFMPLEDFYATEMHRLGLARIGVNHQICGVLAMVDAVAYAITVNRTDHGFTERERTMLNTLHPHLVTSFLNVQAFRKAGRTITQLKSVMEVAPGAYGYFDERGELGWLQSRTQDWLREFFVTETKTPGGVPLRLQQLVKDATVSGCAGHLEMLSATERLVACLAKAMTGGWILRLDRKPLIPPSHFRPLAQLSPRENDVLRWMVEGKRNAEIATILNTSARTVEKQVQSILAKLDVENRASAILRAMELAAAQQHGAGI